jgi:hypothetical protein
MEAVKRSEKILTDGEMTKTQWAAQASSIKRGKKLVAAPERRPIWMDIMSVSAFTRSFSNMYPIICLIEMPRILEVHLRLSLSLSLSLSVALILGVGYPHDWGEALRFVPFGNTGGSICNDQAQSPDG